MLSATQSLSDRPNRQGLRLRAFRRNLAQAAIVAIAGVLLVVLGYAIRASLAARGIAFSFDYLGASAGFEISEGITYAHDVGTLGFATFSSDMTNAQALVAGLFNTLKVAILAIVLATVIGVLLGVGRLSTNWLIRQICFYVVEFLRNTPLLIQLTFWYVAVVLQFPPVADATHFLGTVISQQGLWLPFVVASQQATTLSVLTCLLTILLVLYAATTRHRRLRIGLLLGAAFLAGVTMWSGFPFAVEFPEVGRFRANGGLALTPEFAAILIAISINSSAYLGEVVRGAIESLPKGQWEAAGSLGFSRRDTLKDIILPQVFRVVLPSFGNQYIGLAKNTSLGIAIGFPDLFNIYGTVANQTGRSLEGVIIVMIVYLLLSWTISACVNAVNIKLKIPGAR